jgi:hypothetical protein
MSPDYNDEQWQIDRKTLAEKIAELTPERQAQIERRVDELLADQPTWTPEMLAQVERDAAMIQSKMRPLPTADQPAAALCAKCAGKGYVEESWSGLRLKCECKADKPSDEGIRCKHGKWRIDCYECRHET